MVKQSVLIQKKALNEVMNDMIEPFCCCCSTVNEDCVGEAPPLPGSLSITLSSDSCWATVPFSFLLSLLHSNRGTRGGSFACKVILRLLLHTHTKPHTRTHTHTHMESIHSVVCRCACGCEGVARSAHQFSRCYIQPLHSSQCSNMYGMLTIQDHVQDR